jgi:hypothetical protein
MIEGGGRVAACFVTAGVVDAIEWFRAPILLGGDGRPGVAGLALERALDATSAHLTLAVRVLFTGMSAAHSALAADEGQLRQEVVAQAVALDPDRVWIEKVRVVSEAPTKEQLLYGDETQGSMADLAGLTLVAKDDPDFLQSLQADWLGLLEKLPHEVLQASPELQALRLDPLAQVPERLRQAAPMLMGRVVQSAGSSS